MLVRCDCRRIEPDGHAQAGVLIRGTYFVLSAGYDYYRLVDEPGMPCLFQQDMFTIVDQSWPDGREEMQQDDGTVELGVPEFEVPGFWIDVWEREPYAVDAYLAFLERCGQSTQTGIRPDPGFMTRQAAYFAAMHDEISPWFDHFYKDSED